MREIWKQLWEGENDHPMAQIKKSADYGELAQRFAAALDELASVLPPEVGDKVWRAIEAQEELSANCEKEAFMRGVQLGRKRREQKKKKTISNQIKGRL